MTAPAAAVVNAFLDAIEALDFETAAACLATDGFFYTSPQNTFRSSQEFIANFSRVEPILKSIERHATLSEGNQASMLLTIRTHVPDLASTRIALWATVLEGRIVRLEFVYDASAYASLFESF